MGFGKSSFIAALFILTFSFASQTLAKTKVDPKTQPKADTEKVKQDITARLAMDTLVDYWKKNTGGDAAKPENDPQKTYDIKSAQITRKKMKGCDGKNTEMILVTFKSTKDTGHAWARFNSEADLSTKTSEHMGFSSQPLEDLMKNALTPDCDEH